MIKYKSVWILNGFLQNIDPIFISFNTNFKATRPGIRISQHKIWINWTVIRETLELLTLNVDVLMILWSATLASFVQQYANISLENNFLMLECVIGLSLLLHLLLVQFHSISTCQQWEPIYKPRTMASLAKEVAGCNLKINYLNPESWWCKQ